MNRNWGESYRVAIPKTVDGNGIAEAIYAELAKLGHRPEFFPLSSRAPDGVDVIFFFGPFGKFLHIPEQYSGPKLRQRPLFVFWNTEGLPDPRYPWMLTHTFSAARSWLGRFSHALRPGLRYLASKPPLLTLEPRLLRFRYLGDYLYAQRRGWVDVFADISAVYAGYLRQRGLPAIVAPFGSFPEWYADLDLKRDIDVLWMGKRATKRRSLALDQLRKQLHARGVTLYVADNVENPFVFGEDRTRLLNRSKITLNLLRTWYDENSLRICMAAPNRSLVVSEPLLPHVPQYQPGVHYVSAPFARLADTIVYYLEHDEELQRIVDNAYQLTTTTLTFANSMQTIMEACTQAMQRVSLSLAGPLHSVRVVEK